MDPIIDIRRELLVEKYRLSLFKTCRPKLLVVTDNLSFSSGDDFGLTQFVASLLAKPIYGMTPTVVKASRKNDSTADITGFTFDHATHGVKISRYDVVFLLGVDREFQTPISPDERKAIVDFMQAGGGVFATGDHEDLGAAISAELPRVRSMRYWKLSETPNISNTTRLSTNLPGANDIYELIDQSDTNPQRLYVNYRTQAGGIGEPHPLLQSPLGPVEVFPDHPHEGECHLPTDLAAPLVDGSSLKEWPNATIGLGPVVPEMVALSMSHGDSFDAKAALTPRSFVAICAYDGHRAGVGRVSTDATWHHFVNVNIDGTESPRSGLQNPPGTDTPEMAKIREYYANLARWLMPKKVRKCLRYPWILEEVARFPLFEELRLRPLEVATPEQLRDTGEQVAAALEHRFTKAAVAELVADVLEDGIGEDAAAALGDFGARFGGVSAKEIGLAALGAVTTATAQALDGTQGKENIDVEKVFVAVAEKAAKVGARQYVAHCQKPLQVLAELLGKLAR